MRRAIGVLALAATLAAGAGCGGPKAMPAPETPPPSDTAADVMDSPAKAAAAQRAWAERLNRPVEWTNSVGMRFRLIPPGEFVMGADDLMGLETPHVVRLTRPFYLGMHEVTRREWEAVTSKTHSTFFPGEDMPINFVTWYHVQEFLSALNKKEKAGYRLPTEAEWEYAARAGSSSSFIVGNAMPDLDRVAWYAGNSGNALHPVGRKESNAFGLHDMLGNVWEWCEDFYDPEYYGISPREDPKNDTATTFRYRSLRGGAMYFNAYLCRVSHRAWYQESRSEKHIGFRVVLPIAVESSEGR